ncbi:hypothetical protein [Synechococcus sp. PCC 6312]|uniref:phosphoribosyltransferase-like protein n=1 Tax=Synechococcus sp. (strain ATCC 27167 / PCC 6312) TaxID=195253 RepID=UPI00029EFBB7|nr:hypothetical protein [Synechococcus sp. PCC 6312]AFY61887.1 hypothetical protein Syn6312_2811 [Synechococcus sp. PCC 6312]
MKDELAERLLASVMGWAAEDVAQERPLLQAMAAYKYDEYGQFSPGMRFVESLALWLQQFSDDDRKLAYGFVKQKLIFCSRKEMEHLVSMAYPDIIRPILLDYTAKKLGIPNRYISKIAASKEFKILQRRCLFLGLSDGAHTDLFRRSNPELSHEQIWQAYEISPDKAEDMLKDLSKDLEEKLKRKPTRDESCFQMVFLLDDFSASGLSYLRKEDKSEKFKGKIAKFYGQLNMRESDESDHTKYFLYRNNLYIYLVLYMATQQAYSHLNEISNAFFVDKPIQWGLKVVQQLSDQVPLNDIKDSSFLALIDKDSYYDSNVENKHTQVGGNTVKRGFADCSLPLVLSHNTPNNSIFLLWSDPEMYKVRGLFPRVSRHRS